MDVLANNALLIVLGGILAAILFFIIFKGAIRMIVLATAIILAVAAWIFLQRNGFTYLSFVTDSPQPWMVQVLAWGVGIFILLLFFHIISWFTQLFSWKRRLSAEGAPDHRADVSAHAVGRGNGAFLLRQHLQDSPLS